jgi:hypothetical protein
VCKELQQSHAMIRQQIEATESLAKEQAQWHRCTQHNTTSVLIPPSSPQTHTIYKVSLLFIILWLIPALCVCV